MRWDKSVFRRAILCVCLGMVLTIRLDEIKAEQEEKENPNLERELEIEIGPGGKEEKGLQVRFGFGSCSKDAAQNESQVMNLWESVERADPSLWLWLGGGGEADRTSFPLLWEPSPLDTVQAKYSHMLSSPAYSHLTHSLPSLAPFFRHPSAEDPKDKGHLLVLGIPDDHDRNFNNGQGSTPGINDPFVKDIFLRFLGEPSQSPRWHRSGFYIAYSFFTSSFSDAFAHSNSSTPRRHIFKLILLDPRSFSNPSTGDILGEDQWNWLERQLEICHPSHPEQIFFIASPIQILPFDKPFAESWIH